MMLPDILVPTYTQMLDALSAWLTKAEAQWPDGEAEALMLARLAPDMFPLSTQVRFACVQALEGVARLRGEAFPDLVEVLLNEGRDSSDNPGTVVQARDRIAETLEMISAAGASMPHIDPDSALEHTLPQGMVFDLTAGIYVRDWALPQFYFHLVTAYAILRAQNVDLGKADYVAHMFGYLRQGDAPQG